MLTPEAIQAKMQEIEGDMTVPYDPQTTFVRDYGRVHP